MIVQELREKLDLLDGECEILVIDDQYCVHGCRKCFTRSLF